MNRFAKIMQVLGGLGVALLTVVWTQGFLVSGEAAALARHSTIALVAALLCLLPRFWTIAYLLLAARGRASRRRPAPGAPLATGGRRVSEPSGRPRQVALVVSGIALIALAGSFALAGAVVLRTTSPLAHTAAGLVAIVLQVLALRLERRALLADAGAMAAMPPETASSTAGEPVGSAS